MTTGTNRTLKSASAASSRETAGELGLDLLCCLLLSTGTALLMNNQFEIRFSFWQLLWHAAVILVGLTLLTRRWWILPLTAGTGLVGMAFYLLITRRFAATLATVGDFFLWWFQDLPQDSEWYTEATMHLVLWLIQAGLCCVMFFQIRCVRRTWPLAAVSVGTLLAVMLFGRSDGLVACEALVLAGLIPLVSRDHLGGWRLFSHQERFPLLGRRAAPALIVSVIGIAAAGGIFALLPENTSGWRTRLCSDLMADFQSFTGAYTNDQRGYDVATLDTLGLQNGAFRMGGDLKPPESTVLATVDADQSLLLRATTFDQFSGILWSHSFATDYRVNGLWDDQQTAAFSGTALDNPDWVKAAAGVFDTREVTVTLKGGGSGSEFAPRALLSMAQMTSFKENVHTKNPVLYNDKSELFTFYRMPENYSYTFTARQFRNSTLISSEDYISVMAASSSAADSRYDDSQWFARYTALPEEYSEAAREIADTIYEKGTNPYQRVVLMSHYFCTNNGFSYTETPGKMKRSENVVDKLLTTKKGYCVYYATALATMARYEGIPSRLAAGYKTVWSDDMNSWVVSTAHPYVWVECYFRGFGWVSFDPTPTTLSMDVMQAIQQQTQPKPEEVPQEKPEEDPEEEQEEPVYVTLAIPWQVFPAVALALLVLWLIVRGALAGGFYQASHVNRRFRTPACRAEYYYCDILRQLRCLGYTPAASETLDELTARLPEALRQEDLLHSLTVIKDLHYGGVVPDDRQVNLLERTRARMENVVRKKMGCVVYLVRRRVLLPRHSPTVKKYR